MQYNRFIDIKKYKLSDEVYARTLRAFRRLELLKMELDRKQKEQEEKYGGAYEDRLPYKSSSCYENNVRVFGGSQMSPQERVTIQFDEDESALLRLTIRVAELETALQSALDAAIAQASISIRPRVKIGLEKNLVEGIPAYMIKGISGHTLAKYRRIAIINAAINLEYIHYDESELFGSNNPADYMPNLLGAAPGQ